MNNTRRRQKPSMVVHHLTKQLCPSIMREKSILKELGNYNPEKSVQFVAGDRSKMVKILQQYGTLGLQKTKEASLEIVSHSLTYSPRRNVQFWATSNLFISKKKNREEVKQKEQRKSVKNNEQQVVILEVEGISHKETQLPLLRRRGSRPHYQYKQLYNTIDNDKVKSLYSTKYCQGFERQDYQKPKRQLRISPEQQYQGKQKKIEVDLNKKLESPRQVELFFHNQREQKDRGNTIRFSPWRSFRNQHRDSIFESID